jgi:predicted RNase H-like HicB family nuclease
VTHYAIIVFWSDEDAAWVADVPDLKSCSAFGATPEEVGPQGFQTHQLSW